MPIIPLPIFEEDADPNKRDALTLEEQLENVKVPETLVVRFGSLGMIGEYKQAGDIIAGCGSKLVARTHRGTEIADLLTTTCSSAGCAQSINRQDILDYIEKSGGKNFPFNTNGRVLRIATEDDIARMSELRGRVPELLKEVRALVEEHQLAMDLVDVELILGEELLTFYFLSEDRVDFRRLVSDLASKYSARIEMRQVGSRDESRLVADYERCGRQCCCKSFLKVLTPVSMRSAKQQKQTLDPHKISGRCGRLMCCLRYEDKTYRELKKNLPHKKTRVGTAEGPGIVIEGKILTQLVLVELEHDSRRIAVPIEELLDPETCPKPWNEQVIKEDSKPKRKGKRNRKRGKKQNSSNDNAQSSTDDSKKKKRKRNRRNKRPNKKNTNNT